MPSPIFTILGLDPGTNSFAYCVLDVFRPVKGKFRARVKQHGMIHSTIRSLTSPETIQSELKAFKTAIHGLQDTFHPDLLIAERYMLRRGQGGTAIECINMMLGVLLELGLPTKYIPASQWKNAVTRTGAVLDEVYPDMKVHGITPHQTDASHIATYGALSILKLTHQFDAVPAQIIKAKQVHIGTPFKRPPKRKKRK